MTESMGYPASHELVVGDFQEDPYQCIYKIESRKIEVWSEEAREFNVHICMSEEDLKKFHEAICEAYYQGKADGLNVSYRHIKNIN